MVSVRSTISAVQSIMATSSPLNEILDTYHLQWILQATFARIVEAVYCDLAVAKETFYPRNLAFAVQKDWPYKDLFNAGSVIVNRN